MQPGEDVEMTDILDKNDDDEDEHLDGPEDVLLGHQLPQPLSHPKGLWSQIQGIVIEVRYSYVPAPTPL
jgi:solute carrier family 41